MAPKTILLSGACGSGKSEAMRRMRARFQPTFGETATIDVDLVYTMADPDYAIPFPEAEAYWSLARAQCVRLAEGYFARGFGCVVIGGNSLYQKRQLNEILDRLLAVSRVFHVTLDPSAAVIQTRIGARSHSLDRSKTPEWIEGHVRYMRQHYEEWTARLDNAALSPDETVDAIRDAVLAGCGRLHEMFPL